MSNPRRLAEKSSIKLLKVLFMGRRGLYKLMYKFVACRAKVLEKSFDFQIDVPKLALRRTQAQEIRTQIFTIDIVLTLLAS